jgi:hypothetical protein
LTPSWLLAEARVGELERDALARRGPVPRKDAADRAELEAEERKGRRHSVGRMGNSAVANLPKAQTVAESRRAPLLAGPGSPHTPPATPLAPT